MFPLTTWLSVSFYMDYALSLPYSQTPFIRPRIPIQMYNKHIIDQNSQSDPTLKQRNSRLLRERSVF